MPVASTPGVASGYAGYGSAYGPMGLGARIQGRQMKAGTLSNRGWTEGTQSDGGLLLPRPPSHDCMSMYLLYL